MLAGPALREETLRRLMVRRSPDGPPVPGWTGVSTAAFVLGRPLRALAMEEIIRSLRRNCNQGFCVINHLIFNIIAECC